MSGISDQVALFGATKLHATGSEHGKVKHGMELLKELKKRDHKIQLQACEHSKNIISFRLSEKLTHAEI